MTAYDERSGYRERMLKAEARAEAAEKRVKELEEALAEAIGRYRRQAAALEAKP